MSKKPKLTEEEQNLFRAAVAGITPLRQDKHPVTQPKEKVSPITPTHNPSDQEWSLMDYFPIADDPDSQPVSSEEFLSFARTGLQPRAKQQLRRGDFPIEATLDLHGMNINQAQQAMMEFFAQAIAHHCRCVLVIHGKGSRIETHKPILKNKVNQWLRKLPNILAFSSAKQQQGGVGAVYVLLKRANA